MARRGLAPTLIRRIQSWSAAMTKYGGTREMTFAPVRGQPIEMVTLA